MSAYRLDAPRPRQRPDPLQIDHAMSFKSASALNQQSPPLLYEVPSPFSTSPPGSPRSHLTSPTSPTFKRRSINRQPRSGERTPPLASGRNRSVTPVGDGDLSLFAEQCRAWCVDTQTYITLTHSFQGTLTRMNMQASRCPRPSPLYPHRNGLPMRVSRPLCGPHTTGPSVHARLQSSRPT